jgi:serine/threonine-protein kinase
MDAPTGHIAPDQVRGAFADAADLAGDGLGTAIRPLDRRIGVVLDGYRIEERIGGGGMSQVYRAFHPVLKRAAAVKFQLTPDPVSAERFMREARLAAGLNHPNIVTVYQVGRHDGTPYLTCEFMPGGNVADHVKANGPMAPAKAAATMLDIARALAVAHRKQIIHRDVKPDNLLLAADGTVKLGDFGVARNLDDENRLTRTGAMLGTPQFASPEQLDDGGSVGPASDVYSLACTLFFLLTGRPPFESQSVHHLVFQHMYHPFPDARTRVPAVPAELAAFLIRAAAKKAADRPADAGVFAEELEALLAGGAPGAGGGGADSDEAAAERRSAAFRKALARGERETALAELAAGLGRDPRRRPFPDSFEALDLLPVSGPAAEFRARRRDSGAAVLIRSIPVAALGREPGEVFAEWKRLGSVDLPELERPTEWGVADTEGRTVYAVYAPPEGRSLAEHVRAQGTFAPDDWLPAARRLAEALDMAAANGLFHGGMRPGAVWVRTRRDGPPLLRLTGFGLSAATIAGNSGTEPPAQVLEYAAPERLGRSVAPDATSEICSFAKVCCFALLGTPQPSLQHWRLVPEKIAELLGDCLSTDPRSRPRRFSGVAARLKMPEPTVPILPESEPPAKALPRKPPEESMPAKPQAPKSAPKASPKPPDPAQEKLMENLTPLSRGMVVDPAVFRRRKAKWRREAVWKYLGPVWTFVCGLRWVALWVLIAGVAIALGWPWISFFLDIVYQRVREMTGAR